MSFNNQHICKSLKMVWHNSTWFSNLNTRNYIIRFYKLIRNKSLRVFQSFYYQLYIDQKVLGNIDHGCQHFYSISLKYCSIEILFLVFDKSFFFIIDLKDCERSRRITMPFWFYIVLKFKLKLLRIRHERNEL